MKVLELIQTTIATVNKVNSQVVALSGMMLGGLLVILHHPAEGRDVLMGSFAIFQHKSQQE